MTRKTASAPSASKKRKDLKSKAVRQLKEESKSGVLGGADYVTLMLGGRRFALSFPCRSRALMNDFFFQESKGGSKKVAPAGRAHVLVVALITRSTAYHLSSVH